MAVHQRAVMQSSALRINPKAQTNTEGLNDMSNADWISSALMAPEIMIKQTGSFDQTPLAKMRPTQPEQTLSWVLCL
jgi:hypothetical protein